jgi:hypothetical protein
MNGPWAQTFNRYMKKGHDHGSAAYAADQAEKRAANECPSTHCNRSDECRSPHDCSSKLARSTLAEMEGK